MPFRASRCVDLGGCKTQGPLSEGECEPDKSVTLGVDGQVPAVSLALAVTHGALCLQRQCASYRRGRGYFNMIEFIIDPKGSIRSEPFKDYFTRRKNDADRNPANAADSAYVLVAHQVKYT